MMGIHGEVYRTIELLVGTDIAEGFFLGEWLSGRAQQFGNRHRAPPCGNDSARAELLV
jgi:hypothetical protein